jgi:hypothetical protein
MLVDTALYYIIAEVELRSSSVSWKLTNGRWLYPNFSWSFSSNKYSQIKVKLLYMPIEMWTTSNVKKKKKK